MKRRNAVITKACVAVILLGMIFPQTAAAAPQTETATFALG